ncbi:G-protein coupled receptor 4-like [Anabas testudineus]|uniref:G-protein coupled receptors family 1 profile domain-containing protein n=1 Tax=Anabas testudineus TaxID=64144 RepID=A0A3Q1IX91_ANATE|nr:G-protein coupled receptor 4-like [Anabas testudineus]XP_026209470.1 G-protein coupled receptor 4-like [Anabas testudineus]
MDLNSTSQSRCDYSNVTAAFYLSNSNPGPHMVVVTCVIIAVSLPVTMVAIYAVYSLVQKDNVAPVYVINLLISDLIQLCSMVVAVATSSTSKTFEIFFYIYHFGVTTSVCFMVCIALERYLVIGCPLWYRFRRTIKISLGVCVVVWAFALTYILLVYFCYTSCFLDAEIIFDVFFLVPLPLLIFFLGGTIKALSTASRMPTDEKRRIVALIVLVLLIYTLLFLPAIIWSLADKATVKSLLSELSYTFIQFSPLADSFLYVFLRKGAADRLLVSMCCCRIDSKDVSISREGRENN